MTQDTVAIARAVYEAYEWKDRAIVPSNDRAFVTYIGTNKDGQRFRNTELLTVRNGQLVDAEVYFGWSIPHKASPGGFLKDP